LEARARITIALLMFVPGLRFDAGVPPMPRAPETVGAPQPYRAASRRALAVRRRVTDSGGVSIFRRAPRRVKIFVSGVFVSGACLSLDLPGEKAQNWRSWG
jgi:hypothetical protein